MCRLKKALDRREVVGQILDYARALARLSYDDLQREISAATRRPANVLFDLVRETGGEGEEARFVDRVSRDLAAGRFILLVVGDGITEGTRRIGEYLRDQPGLAFSFGLLVLLITTLLAGRGSLLTPIAAPIAFLPIKSIPGSTVGRISPGDANYDVYREHLRRITDEPFALFLQG